MSFQYRGKHGNTIMKKSYFNKYPEIMDGKVIFQFVSVSVNVDRAK